MTEVTLDACTCTCESAKVLVEKVSMKAMNPWEIGLVVIIIIIIIIALIIGFKKLNPPEEEGEEDFSDVDRYY